MASVQCRFKPRTCWGHVGESSWKCQFYPHYQGYSPLPRIQPATKDTAHYQGYSPLPRIQPTTKDTAADWVGKYSWGKFISWSGQWEHRVPDSTRWHNTLLTACWLQISGTPSVFSGAWQRHTSKLIIYYKNWTFCLLKNVKDYCYIIFLTI